MSEAIRIGRKSVDISVESGVTMGIQKLSETYTTGSMSGGFGSVSTSVKKHTEFALIGTDGVERPHWFSGHDVFLRDGHRISLIHASYRSSNWAYIVNHDTRKVHNIWFGSDYVYYLGLVRKIGWTWLLLATVAIVALASAPETEIDEKQAAIVVFGAWILLKTVQRWRARRIWKGRLRPAFERIKTALLESTGEISWPSSRLA